MQIYKLLAGLSGVFIIGVLCWVIYFSTAHPITKHNTDIQVKPTSVSIERGFYLANYVTVCTQCHSKRDWTMFSGPIITDSIGMGGERFDNNFANVPGILFSKNITPSSLKNWTNCDIYNLITKGLTKDNKVIFPMMPYLSFSNMDSDDVKSIICYLRTLKPIDNQVSESNLNFPENIAIRIVPKVSNTSKKPLETDTVLYGKYLVSIAGCIECHTPKQYGRKIIGKEFSGGLEFSFKNFGKVRTSNITPDIETGIGSWQEDMFINNFKKFSDSLMAHIMINNIQFQTTMPWTMYSGMKTSDLKAIYKYLMTLKPIKNNIIKFTPS